MRQWYRVRAKGRLAENHRHFRFAEALGSDWRFFATYAGV
jgi:hypothetical protein